MFTNELKKWLFILGGFLFVIGVAAVLAWRGKGDFNDEAGRSVWQSPTGVISDQEAGTRQAPSRHGSSDVREAIEEDAEQRIQGMVWYGAVDQAPAPGVRVTARMTTPPHTQEAVTTDRDGVFRLPVKISNVNYSLIAEERSTGQVTVDDRNVHVPKAKDVEDVHLVIEAGGAVSGQVFGDSLEYSTSALARIRNSASWLSQESFEKVQEAPLEGVEVVLTAVGVAPVEHSAVTDAKGFYQFTGLPSGHYKVLSNRPIGAVLDDRELFKHVEILYPPRMAINGIDFHLRMDGLTITGKVSDSQGRPLADTTILVETQLEEEPGAGGAAIVAKTQSLTDSDGKYQVSGLRPMKLEHTQLFLSSGIASIRHKLSAMKGGYETRSVIVPAIIADTVVTSDTIQLAVESMGYVDKKRMDIAELPLVKGRVISDVDFVLTSGASVKGVLVSSQGKPLPYYQLQILELGSVGSTITRQIAQVMVEAKGKFSFTGLPAGTYIFCGNGVKARNAPLTLKLGDAIEEYTLSLEGPEDRGQIHGTVIAEGTKFPVREFMATVVGFVNPAPASGELKGTLTKTNPEKGEFHISDISPGQVTLRVDAEGYASAFGEAVVHPGEITQITIAMRAGGDIEGLVSLHGEPTSAAIRVYAGNETTAIQATADEHGQFVVSDLPAGDYFVVAFLELVPQYSTKRRAHTWATVTSGQVTTVDFAFNGASRITGIFSFFESYDYAVVAVRDEQWLDTPIPLNDRIALEEQVLAEDYLEETGTYILDALSSGSYIVTGVCYRLSDDGKPVDVVQKSYAIQVNGEEEILLDVNLR